MLTSKFFKAEKVLDYVTRIGGLGGELCYLVEGTESALLIDGLAGAGSLKAFVRELTDLPVTLVNTHGHVDHIGADFEYGEIYIDPRDIPLLYQCGDRQERYSFVVNGMEYAGRKANVRLDDVTAPRPVRTLPLWDGKVFDLGGVKLETISVPGHTKGSAVFLDRESRAIFSGDFCNPYTLMFQPEAVSIEKYRESLIKLSEYQNAFDKMYCGHGDEPEPSILVAEAIELCSLILSGKDDAVEVIGFGGTPCLYAKKVDESFRRTDGGRMNIAYSKERVWKKQVEERGYEIVI